MVLVLLGLFWARVSCDNHGDAEASWELCRLPSDRGQFCDGWVVRYFYNDTTSQCERFWYGGCDGNKNNFESEDECDDRCGNTKGTGEFLKLKITSAVSFL